jgi:hypothetical protein
VKDKPAGPDADWLILNANMLQSTDMQINTHYNFARKATNQTLDVEYYKSLQVASSST